MKLKSSIVLCVGENSLMTRKNQVDELLTRFERKDIKREKCLCCDFDADGFGKNIIGKGYGSCEIRLYRATKYDFYIYSYSVGAEALLKDWFEIYSQKVRFCPVCGRRLSID